MSVTKWRLINYFDVWGNAKEGWDVNNVCVEAENLIIPDVSTDKKILDFLKQKNLIFTSDMRRVRLVDLGEVIEIEAVKGCEPLGRLEVMY